MAPRGGSRSEPSVPGLFDDLEGDRGRSSPRPRRGAAAAKKAKEEPAEGSAAGAPAEPAREEPPAAEPEPAPLTVTQLTRRIGADLADYGRLSVEGEISGMKRAASGHVYFDLKDEGAKVSCVVWRSQRERALATKPAEGDEVVVHGRLDVYAPRGSYSLIAERVEARGLGARLAELERLKAELQERGWFGRSRPLPRWPTRVGIVTSRDGAALQDFLRTRTTRWPLYPVRLSHTPVQGASAAREIAAAIARLDASGVDVIVVTRGGGSLEDLWAFNELPVAEAIWKASVPVVSAVGHETDVTLADFVADHRAHTPTDAAQTVLPDRQQLVERLERAASYLDAAVDRVLTAREDRVGAVARSRSLASPDWIVADRAELLARRGEDLRRSALGLLERRAARVGAAHARLASESPAARVERWIARLGRTGERLLGRGDSILRRHQERLAGLARALEATSPLAVLARGYSTTRLAGAPELLRDAAAVAPGDELETRLARGRVKSRVTAVEPEPREARAPDTEPP